MRGSMEARLFDKTWTAYPFYVEYKCSRDSSVSSYGVDDRGSILGRIRIFFFRHRFQTGSGSHQPPIQWVPATLFAGIKQAGREADHSPHSRVQVKYMWCYTSTSLYIFMAWCLVKHRASFPLSFRPGNNWFIPFHNVNNMEQNPS
jgi:hypothetical protein